mgnify:CR=1 FL=1
MKLKSDAGIIAQIELPGLEHILFLLGLICLFVHSILETPATLLASLVLLPAATCAYAAYRRGVRGLSWAVITPLSYAVLSLILAILRPPRVTGWVALVAPALILLAPVIVAAASLVSSLVGGVIGLVVRRLAR